MKRLLAVFLFCLSFAQLANASWTSITQADRNARIIAQAQHDYGLVGGACKPWAYDVVRVASNLANGFYGPGLTNAYTRLLPATSSFNGEWAAAYYWDSNQYVSGITAQSLPYIVPGNIIQMRIRMIDGSYTPHTAIVESNTVGQSLTFLESNYSGNYVVGRRTITYNSFIDSIQNGSYYTVYTIY